MITDEEVLLWLERADPARVDDVAPVIDAAVYLDALRTRSTSMIDLEATPTPAPPTGRRRWAIIAAAAAVVALIVAGAIVLATRDDPDEPPVAPPTTLTPPSSPPSDTAAAEGLLAPPADLDELVVTDAAEGRWAPGVIRAAARTPSNEIVGITVNGGPFFGGPGVGGTEIIAGRQVGVGRGLSEDFWTYSVFRDCFKLDVTASGRPEVDVGYDFAIPADIETLFQGMTITDGAGAAARRGGTVTVALAPGWQSLGTATESDRYVLNFSANVGQTDVVFELDQRPGIGVGVLLADAGRTNPRPTTLSGRPSWTLTDSDGWTTLVFDDAGTAVSLRARGLDEDALVAFAATLVRRPWSETSALVDRADSAGTPAEEELPGQELPVPAGCDVSLDIASSAATSTQPSQRRHGVAQFPAAGPLAPGEHEWVWRPTLPTPVYRFTVLGPGWRSGGYKKVPGGGGSIEKGTPGTSDGAVITFWRPDRVYADPCDHTSAIRRSAPQPSWMSNVFEAVKAIPGIELVSGPTYDPTEYRPVYQVVLRIPKDIECDPQQFYLWAAGEHQRAAAKRGSTITVNIIEPPAADGPPIFVEGETYEGASADLEREVQQIVDSVRSTGEMG